MFDEQFILALPENPNLAAKVICDNLEDLVVESIRNPSGQDYEEVLTGMGILQAFVESLNFNVKFPKLGSEADSNILLTKGANKIARTVKISKT